MQLRIFDSAERDLEDGYHFYERQSQGLGIYFLDSLYSDIDSLLFFLQVYIVKSLGIIVFLPDAFLLPFITKSPKTRF